MASKIQPWYSYQFAHSIQDLINLCLANSVVSTGIVVGSVLLASDQLLWVEQLAVGSSANLVWKRSFDVKIKI